MKYLNKIKKSSFYIMMSNIKRHYLGREKRTSYGIENPDKFYYVIGQDDLSCGLWWIVNKVVMHLAYAEEKGYIPIVDYLNFKTQYHNPNEIGKVNVWEKFFEQPSNISLEDIKNSKNIILSDQYSAPSPKYLMGNTDFYTDMGRRDYFVKCFKKNIHFSNITNEYLEQIRNMIIPKDARVLGVLCRGTDYALKRPKGHPIPPTAEEVISKARDVMDNYHCEYLFLATEDAGVLEKFRCEFGNKLLFVEQKRISYDDMKDVRNVMDANIKVNKDRYKMGLDYLCATYILSKCNCFVAARCGGAKGVLLMTDGFEYEYIYNLGFFE